jgi:hypothetical protein
MVAVVMPTALQDSQNKPSALENKGVTKTIRGVVRDLYCPMVNLASTAHEFDAHCAEICLRAGSPVVIQSEDGEFYFPLSDAVPDADQHPKLLPFAGKTVEATGVVRSRKGVNSITIEKIQEVKAGGK